MGYYVNIEDIKTPNGVLIKKEYFVEAYNNLCWLNTNPDFDLMKKGGSHGGEFDSRSARPDGLDYHPAKWYSWMDADYHLKLKTLHEVLTAIGFDITDNEQGIESVWYNEKNGNEDIFLTALAPFIESGSEITWIGEDNIRWKLSFKDGKMFHHASKTMYQKEGKWITLASRERVAKQQFDLFNEMREKLKASEVK
jgi:hypothetical protein